MSRIGKKPVAVPDGVEVQISGQQLTAKGKLGSLELSLHGEVSAVIEDVANDDGKSSKIVRLSPKSNSKFAAQIWPTMRTLVDNICIGVSQGYVKNLEIHGVGYRANLQGTDLVLALGFSHEVRYAVPSDVKIEIEKQTRLKISGIDKQRVGQIAAEIRAYKKPEPYKGKGIRYADEYIIRKEGKKK